MDHNQTGDESLLTIKVENPESSRDFSASSEQASDHPTKITLERQVTSRRETVTYVLLLIFLDLSKMMSSYALKYYNGDVYPVKQTLLVLATEMLKLFLILHLMITEGSLKSISLSALFALPSLIYAVNNNLFLYALNFTSPAVWSILTQSRVVITACVYRVIFKRSITYLQWFALFLLCLAIVVTKVSGDSGSIYVEPAAFVIAAVVSVLSVTAAIFMEFLFKNNKRSFSEQQLQLYLFSSVFASVFYATEVFHASNSESPAAFPANNKNTTAVLTTTHNIIGDSNILPVMLLATVQFGAMSGLVTASVIKKLDNIVKIYSQSLTGILNAVVSAYLFPRTFQPDWKYFFSLVLVLIAISLYERKFIRFANQSSTLSPSATTASTPR